MRCLLFFAALSFVHASPVRDFWFNGAEISSYELSQSRYGENHPGHAELIFVTEPFLVVKQVKKEGAEGEATDVLKLNALTTFNTGLYSYRTMTSTFRPINLAEFPHALKSATGIQDWCGQVFQQTNRKKNGWEVELRSYFENAGDQDLTLPDAVLEDELWITLRLDPKALPQGEFVAIPGAVFSRFEHLKIEPAKALGILRQNGLLSVYSVSYPALGRSLGIQFETAFPHRIAGWFETTPKGTTTAKLKKRMENVEYWKLHDRKDAGKRREVGLEPVAD